ncbi:MAG TPA: NUDIX domain-containing protein [Chloroflexota bacterium]|nr:NUDIX domain-containing protein [Chloroflexota bacterium]
MSRQYYAIGTLYHVATRRVLLHHRDAHAARSPNRWAFFGGAGEAADAGDPITTWLREMQEELGITLDRAGVVALCAYPDPVYAIRRYVYYAPWPSRDTSFQLSEGDGYAWFTLEEALRLTDLTPNARADLLRLRDRLNRAPLRA